MQITELRASKIARSMTCTGSLFLSTPEKPAGEDAANGTAFGELVRHIQMGTNPIPKVASNGVYFDDEMYFHAPIIAKRIPSRATSEIKVGWKTNSGIIVQGSYDFSYHTDDTLFVEDVKYGYGIVDVVKNWQLIVYAIGEVIRLNKVFPNIVFKIHQPRPYHEDGDCREWRFTYQELLEYKEEIEKQAMRIARNEKQFVTSDKCKYCPGVAFECVAFNRAFNNAVDVVLNDTLATGITEQEIASQLNVMERIKDIFKIKKDAVEELAKQRIANGKALPGYMVKPVNGHREWKKGVTPESIKAMCGIDITKREVLSPAQAEQAGVPEVLMTHFAQSPIKGQKLVKQDIGKVADKLFKQPTGG